MKTSQSQRRKKNGIIYDQYTHHLPAALYKEVTAALCKEGFRRGYFPHRVSCIIQEVRNRKIEQLLNNNQ